MGSRFNCLAIPIAAGILYPNFQLRLPPEVAAVAMAASSLCVLFSSILLKTYKSPYNNDNHVDKKKSDEYIAIIKNEFEDDDDE